LIIDREEFSNQTSAVGNTVVAMCGCDIMLG